MKKEEATRTARAARRFMTFHNCNVYAARRRAYILKKEREKEKIPSAGIQLYIYSRWHFYRDARTDARRAEMRFDAQSGAPLVAKCEEEEEEESSEGDRRSSKLAAERYTSQTRIMLFYERGVPTYVPTYLRRPLSCGKTFPENLAEFGLQLHAAASWHTKTTHVYPATSHGTRDRGMVFRADVLEKKSRVVSRKMKCKENDVAVTCMFRVVFAKL